ncbi:MAG TPA: 3' terminal RNA ribose 2'-O-methyltransferase Hen1 [Armatimonadota bacterium]|nr:3' terminal RNA ribose 2'-O-methyltransferase Hen1 [Armatimonadota bacterium]
MLLTITNSRPPATDLGFLLHKNPARCQSFNLNFGKAHVFYPEVGEDRCTAALLLDVDPVGLVRGSRGNSIDQYVNDRPYVASSFLSVAITQLFRTAMQGKSRERPDLPEQALPLTARIAALPCRGGEGFLRRLFEPLGYTVTAIRHPLDPVFPDWGESRYFSVEIAGDVRLKDLLTHLYVLIPVLDDEKHYYIGDDEVEKLLRHGAGWLAAHPERDEIARRYLKHRPNLAQEALTRLVDETDPDEQQEAHAAEEEAVEKRISLNTERLNAVAAALKNSGARRVMDLGCGEGRLIRELLKHREYEAILGMDVSHHALEVAADRLKLDRMPPVQRQRIQLIQGSLNYRDRRLEGYDAAAVVEVIEHLDPPRLSAFERVLFEFARPVTVVITTPNFEYNVRFPGLPAGKFRHRDHRFEWTREEFGAWAAQIAARFGYGVEFQTVGLVDPEVGPPTQMAIFSLPPTAPVPEAQAA